MGRMIVASLVVVGCAGSAEVVRTDYVSAAAGSCEERETAPSDTGTQTGGVRVFVDGLSGDELRGTKVMVTGGPEPFSVTMNRALAFTGTGGTGASGGSRGLFEVQNLVPGGFRVDVNTGAGTIAGTFVDVTRGRVRVVACNVARTK